MMEFVVRGEGGAALPGSHCATASCYGNPPAPAPAPAPAFADCCDGADEGPGCNNTCLEESSHHREALRKSVEQYQTSLAKKSELEIKAAQTRQSWTARAPAIDAELETQVRLLCTCPLMRLPCPPRCLTCVPTHPSHTPTYRGLWCSRCKVRVFLYLCVFAQPLSAPVCTTASDLDLDRALPECS